MGFQREPADVVLSKQQEEQLLEQVDDLLKQRDCPSGMRFTAKEVRDKLTSSASTPEERHEAAKRLAKQIEAFVLNYAKARPERSPPSRRGAVPVPDDTPWAERPSSRRWKSGRK